MKTKIHFLLIVALTIFYSCKQTRYSELYNAQSDIVGISSELRVLSITEANTNKLLIRDTIVGSPIIVNKFNQNLYANINNVSVSKYKYESGKSIVVDENNIDTYVMWFDQNLNIHYRIFGFNEIISSSKISK